MKTVEVSEISSLMEKYDQTEQPLIITRNGQPVAALFSIEDVDLETLSLSTNPQFIRIIEESRKSQQEEGRIFLEDNQFPDNTNPTMEGEEKLIDEYTYEYRTGEICISKYSDIDGIFYEIEIHIDNELLLGQGTYSTEDDAINAGKSSINAYYFTLVEAANSMSYDVDSDFLG